MTRTISACVAGKMPAVQAKEHISGKKSEPLVSVNERMILDNPICIRGGETMRICIWIELVEPLRPSQG